MITIPQYESMLSIYLCVLAALPSMALGLLGKKSRLLNAAASAFVIFSILGLHSLQLFEFLLFTAFELGIVYFYFYFQKRCGSQAVYHLVFALSMLPLLIVRASAGSDTLARYFGFTGLSYICFKIWQILMDIHDQKLEALPILDVLGLILFFPSFSSGPIARYQSFKEESESTRRGSAYFEAYIVPGAWKLLQGLFYKFAAAFAVNTYILAKIPEEATLFRAVLYMYAYTVYLFFDFAGYSRIAVGIGCLMGVRLPENFDKPFLACNMKEFWARWHMSLSSWFNDYVFGRFVLNNVRNGLFKSPKAAARWAYLFTMTTMGLWHGFSLHYLVYGLYEGGLLVITDIYVKSKHYRNLRKKPYYKPLSRAVCFQFIAFGMLLFSGRYLF